MRGVGPWHADVLPIAAAAAAAAALYSRWAASQPAMQCVNKAEIAVQPPPVAPTGPKCI